MKNKHRKVILHLNNLILGSVFLSVAGKDATKAQADPITFLKALDLQKENDFAPYQYEGGWFSGLPSGWCSRPSYSPKVSSSLCLIAYCNDMLELLVKTGMKDEDLQEMEDGKFKYLYSTINNSNRLAENLLSTAVKNRKENMGKNVIDALWYPDNKNNEALIKDFLPALKKKLKKQIKSLKQRIASTTQECNAFETNLGKQEMEIESLKNQLKTKTEKLQNQLKTEKENAENLNQRITQLTKAIQDQKTQMEAQFAKDKAAMNAQFTKDKEAMKAIVSSAIETFITNECNGVPGQVKNALIVGLKNAINGALKGY